MKKFLFLLSLGIYSLSAKSQNFNVSPSSVTSGSDVTLTAVSESNVDHYNGITSVAPAQYNSNVTVTIKSISYWTSSSPTKVVVTVTNSGTQAVTVNLVINGNTYNDVSQSGGSAIGNANQQLQINPASTTPTVFYNVAASVTDEKQSCGGGTMGSLVTYTVPANKYSASTLQAAQQLATNDINANGQNYANANGQCIPVFARLEGTVNDGEGSNVVAHFYTTKDCTTPLALPGSVTLTVTWTKYNYDGTTYTVNSVNTVAQGASTFSIGHREFYLSIPPKTIYVDWVASVVLQGNPSFTTEPNSGIFTSN